MLDGSLERKSSSENRNAKWKTYNWGKTAEASNAKDIKSFESYENLALKAKL